MLPSARKSSVSFDLEHLPSRLVPRLAAQAVLSEEALEQVARRLLRVGADKYGAETENLVAEKPQFPILSNHLSILGQRRSTVGVAKVLRTVDQHPVPARTGSPCAGVLGASPLGSRPWCRFIGTEITVYYAAKRVAKQRREQFEIRSATGFAHPPMQGLRDAPQQLTVVGSTRALRVSPPGDDNLSQSKPSSPIVIDEARLRIGQDDDVVDGIDETDVVLGLVDEIRFPNGRRDADIRGDPIFRIALGCVRRSMLKSEIAIAAGSMLSKPILLLISLDASSELLLLHVATIIYTFMAEDLHRPNRPEHAPLDCSTLEHPTRPDAAHRPQDISGRSPESNVDAKHLATSPHFSRSEMIGWPASSS